MTGLGDPAVFEPHLKTKFVVHGPGRDVPVTLTEVARKIDDEIQLCFIVRFAGAAPALREGMYRLTHDRMGEIELFINPVQSHPPGIVYEAVFNLLKPEPQP